MKPLLLLDVDGVLNPMLSAKSWAKRAGTEGWAKHQIYVPDLDYTFTLHLNSDHGPKLLKATEEAGATLAWATTWDHWANKLLAPKVGLPELEVLETGGYPKYRKVFEQLDGRKFAWLDDETYVIAACEEHPDGHGVWVHDRSGLQQHHLDKAVKLLNGKEK